MNCGNGFSRDGECGVAFIGEGGKAWAVVGTTAGSTPALIGSAVNLIPQGAEHAALSLIYQTPLDITQFTITFSFTPNGQNVALVIQNSTNNPWGFNEKTFSAGAGCEAGFFQGYSQPQPPDHVFALEFDSRSALSHSDAWNFTHSSTQIYSSGVSPCLPDDFHGKFEVKDKISTHPVALCHPPSSQGSTTGHIYQATVSYDGSNLSLDLSDTTKPDTHFTHTWQDVNIPQIVGNSQAWIGFTGATYSGGGSHSNLLIHSFSYTTENKPPIEQPPPDQGQEIPFTGSLTIQEITYQLTGTATPSSKRNKRKSSPL